VLIEVLPPHVPEENYKRKERAQSVIRKYFEKGGPSDYTL